MPTSVQGLLSSFRISGTNFYELAAFGHLQSKGILPGSRSDAMDAPYMTGHWNGISALHRATPVLLLSSTLTRTAGNS